MVNEAINAFENNQTDSTQLINEKKKTRKRNLATCFAIVPITIAFIVSSTGLAVSIYFYVSDSTTYKYWKLYGILCSSYFLALSIITTLFIILLRHCSAKEDDLYTVAVEIRKLEFESMHINKEKSEILRPPAPPIGSPRALATPEPIDNKTMFVLNSPKPVKEYIQYQKALPIKRNQEKEKVIYVQENYQNSKNMHINTSANIVEPALQVIGEYPYAYYSNEVPMVKLSKNAKKKKSPLVLSYAQNSGNQLIEYRETKPKTDKNYIYKIETESEDEYLYQVV